MIVVKVTRGHGKQIYGKMGIIDRIQISELIRWKQFSDILI